MYLTIRIDKENSRFFTVHNNINYELRYNRLSPKVYEIEFLNDGGSTEIGEELLYTAFLFAQKEGIKIIAKCEKASKYLGQHKEFTCVAYKDQIAELGQSVNL